MLPQASACALRLQSWRPHRQVLTATQKPEFPENKAARRTVVRSPKVRVIREKTSLSQSEFALLIGVSVKTLQNWEQDRRQPTGPAVALLRIIAHEPKLAVEAIHRL
jgi:putative transcriptional regulator